MNEREVFTAALELDDPAARLKFLAQACGENRQMRQRIDALLAAHNEAGSFLDFQPLAGELHPTSAPISEAAGTVIGPFKLLQQIGEGGMGVVFMAQQHRPVQRMVALKIIKPGMDTRQVVARFEAERQALALMDHPNIAKVLDAGTTETGRPFFVMELVKGMPITQYCDEHHLSPQQRLELFIPVCQAVQHAHQKGIIHRDLKPSNVMIALYDGQPVPKIIDFGVAKATGPKLTERTMFTEFGAIVGTLEYMSPEQAELNQLDIDTRSDIYSLGVLLYELLTGGTPFEKKRLRSAAFDELLRILREEEPPKPSTRVSTTKDLPSIAASRSLEPKKLSGVLRGELDWIVMKCLEKDRNRRYETANGLAQDVQRYLADEPVQACPPSATYRLRKFARRNKRIMVSAVLLGIMLLVVVGSVAGSLGWVARDRATRQAVADQQIGAALDEANDKYQHDKLAEAMAAVKQAEGLLLTAGGSEQITQRVRQWRKDLEMVARLEEIRLDESAVKDDHFNSAPADSAYQEAFTSYGLNLADLPPEKTGAVIQGSAIRAHWMAALDDWTMVKIVNGLEGYKRLLDVARLADPDPWRNQLRDAIEKADKAGLKKLSDDKSLESQPKATVFLLGNALQKQGEYDAATDVLRKAQRMHTNDFWLNEHLGWYLSRSDEKEALGYYRAALALRPENPGTHVNLGVSLEHLDRIPEAEQEFRQTIELAPDFVLGYLNLARMLIDQGKNDEAEKVAQNASTLNSQSPRAQFLIGNYYKDQKVLPKAEAAYRIAIQLKPKFPEARDQLADSLIDQKEPEQAEAILKDGIQIDPKNSGNYVRLARALRDESKWEQAIAANEQGVQIAPDTAWVLCEMAHTLRSCPVKNLKDLDRAWKLAQHATELDPAYAWGWQVSGEVARDQKNWKEAIRCFDKTVQLDPHNWFPSDELVKLLGNCPDVAFRDPKRAVEIAKKSVELEPKDYRLQRALGRALYRAGQWQGSLEAMQESIALQKNAGNPWDWFYLAMDNWQLGHKDEARKWFDKAVSRQMFSSPDNQELAAFHAEAAQLFGLRLPVTELVKNVHAAAEKQQWSEAQSDCLAAMDWLPIETFTMSARKALCFDVAKYDELYNRIAKVRPDDAELRIARGRRLAVQRKWSEAAAEYEAVRSSIPPRSEHAEYACLMLLNNNQAAYEEFVKQFADEFGTTTDKDILDALAQVAAMGQQKVVPAEKAVEWARSALEGNAKVTWRVGVLTLACYRAGQYDEAIKHAKESSGSGSPGVTVENWLIIALASQKQGDSIQAQKALEEAKDIMADMPLREKYNYRSLPIPELLSINALWHEADTLIPAGTKSTAATP